MHFHRPLRFSYILAVFFCIPSAAFGATDVTDDINTDTHWTVEGSPYVVRFANDAFFPHLLTVAPGATLSIDPGVVVKFDTFNGIKVDGTLLANGIAGNPIIFTSLEDDTAAGDTNGDALATTPADEDWMHVQFDVGSSGSISHAVVRYGGAHQIFVANTGIENFGGTLAVDHTELSHNGFDGFGQHGGHTLLTNSSISGQQVGISMTGGELDVSDTHIFHNEQSGINFAFGGTLSILHSEIDHNGTGILAPIGDGSISVNNSSIHDNATADSSLGIENETQSIDFDENGNPFVVDAGIVIEASNNWWGDASGPLEAAANAAGSGNGIFGNVIYAPWLTVDPFPACATTGCASNVLFLPGIESSRLYRPDGKGGDMKLWEPGLLDTLQDLYLTPSGKSVRADVYAKVGDVVDETPVTGANIYKSFIAKMNGLVSAGTINAWEADPYDWRLSLEDILTSGKQTGADISYLDATSSPYIIQELKRLAATSKTGKVTIVAHSSGGLVAKRLTEVLGPDVAKLIDKLIFVAVPQAGTPAAVAALLHGYDQAFGGGLRVNLWSARTFASTSPMVYNLVPSASYFSQVDDAVITFDSTMPDWISRYGATIHSQDSLHAFLTDSFGRVDALKGDINRPIQGNDALLTGAEVLHATLDNWAPPAGVELIQIAGWGIPTTVSGITYKKSIGLVHSDAQFTVDGDGAVVVPSALWTSTTTGAVNYWVDLQKYNKRTQNQITFGLLSTHHSNILEVPKLLDFLSDQITSTTKPLSDYTYLSTEAPPSTDKRLRYALHSPLTLNLYDDLGRHTGVSTTTGEVEEQIPGTYYTEFGDVKYLFSDASTTARVVMDGYDTGTFTFNVDQYSGNTLTASTTFKDIPTTPSTVVSLGVASDISTLSPMSIDKNGDGTIDATLAPKLGGTVTLDTTPPELRITFATSTNALAFIATDDSGFATTTATTTYPLDKKNQKEKDSRGVATTTVTARDAAGNTTTLVYTEQLPSPSGRDTIVPQALIYNGATTTLTNASLSYKWRINKNGSFNVFASNLRNASTTLESHYRPKKNTTLIMTKPQDLNDSDSDDDSDTRSAKQTLQGMVVPYMVTRKGSLFISY